MKRSISQLGLFVAVVAALAAGCNTGKSGAKNLAPVAAAGPDRVVNAGDRVVLDGSASTDDQGIAAFAWSPVPPGTITLTGANTATAAFTAPVVTAPTVLTFRLTVSDARGKSATDDVTITVNPGFVFRVCDPATAQSEALAAFFEAREGDTIEFCEGTFNFTTGLLAHGRKGLTIRGAGIHKTILDFKDSGASEGLNVSHTDGITIEHLTIRDTPGNALRVFRSRYVTIRGVRTEWSDYATCNPDPTADGSCASHGAYGIYPVECDHVLIEDSESFGASDAGIYVGQSSDIIVRRTRAEYNVAGFEFENTYRALFEDNIATNNTGGFLVFDLPGLRQYGEFNIVRNNKSFNNNIDNFAPIGNIVGSVPRGTGMLMLATDLLEVYGNEVYDNDTTGLAIVNYGLADGTQGDRKYDFFPEGLHIHHNTFRDNGGNPQLPNMDRGEASALPLLIALKNGGKSAHIVWDGAVDEPNECTAANGKVPRDSLGRSLYDPSVPNFDGVHPEGRRDFRGRPNYIRSDSAPDCGRTSKGVTIRYNEWKFTGGAAHPANGIFINNNVFENTQPNTALVDDFVNFHLTTADSNFYPDDFESSFPDPRPGLPPILIDLVTPASNDLTPHAGAVPEPLANIPVPVLDLPYVPNYGSDDARPDPVEVAAVCGKALAPGEINWEALGLYNCPHLHQYGLFADAAEPRGGANGGGLPFDLNSALFSDYAVKYRILFLPRDGAGEFIPAAYRDRARNGVTASLDFPVGTVIAKTFAFRTDDENGVTTAEDVVETRLLIKRQAGTGVTWVGLPYIWNKDASGNLTTADLHVEGGEAAVEFDFLDPDPDVKTADNKRVRYAGATEHYAIPAALNCITCHGGDDREPGAAPLGLKPRYMNRNYDYGGTTGLRNQLSHLEATGRLTVPEGVDLNSVEKHARWNVPGDTGQVPGSAADVHLRVRAYLEVNCMHCHTNDGAASNSNLFLDSFRTVNNSYGICKKPVAAGKGTCEGCLYDIVVGEAGQSILPFRIGSNVPGIRMPPVARSITHGEAANLIAQWIDVALPDLDAANEDSVQDEETCSGDPFDQLSGTVPVP